MILIFERISFDAIKTELAACSKSGLLLTGVAAALMTIAKLGAFQMGEVIVVAPLCSLVIMTNILYEILVLGRKKRPDEEIPRRPACSGQYLADSVVITFGIRNPGHPWLSSRNGIWK